MAAWTPQWVRLWACSRQDKDISHVTSLACKHPLSVTRQKTSTQSDNSVRPSSDFYPRGEQRTLRCLWRGQRAKPCGHLRPRTGLMMYDAVSPSSGRTSTMISQWFSCLATSFPSFCSNLLVAYSCVPWYFVDGILFLFCFVCFKSELRIKVELS